MCLVQSMLLALIGIGAVSVPPASPGTPPDVIARCVAHAGAESRGIEALRTECPDIEPAIRALGPDALLPSDWASRLSAGDVANLRALAGRYAAPPPAPGLVGSASQLQRIALGLRPPAASPSWWDRLKAWLNSRLASDRIEWPGWLQSLARWMPGRALAAALLYALGAGVLLTAAVFVVRELRRSGVLGSHRSPPRSTQAGEPGSAAAPPRDFAELDAAPPGRRAVVLLRLLVVALTSSRRLERDRDLTCRELIGRARFDDGRQRERFAAVALRAEAALYGAAEGCDAEGSAVEGGRELYSQLLVPRDDAVIRAS